MMYMNVSVVMVGVDAGELLSQGALVSLGIGLVCVCVCCMWACMYACMHCMYVLNVCVMHTYMHACTHTYIRTYIYVVSVGHTSFEIPLKRKKMFTK